MLFWLLLALPVRVGRWVDDHLWQYQDLGTDVKAAKAAIKYWPPG
jgi:hypothetical protein